MDRDTVDHRAAHDRPARLAGMWLRLKDGDLVRADQITRVCVRRRAFISASSLQEAAAVSAKTVERRSRFRRSTRARRAAIRPDDRDVWTLCVMVTGLRETAVGGGTALEDVASVGSGGIARCLQHQLVAVLARVDVVSGIIACDDVTASVAVSQPEPPYASSEGRSR
ncbi:hypothetical protein [Amycolatopsis sp. NPDC004079]|uniref:hypothetical protein n=1 Tax=Amycolatopsis sp. NPDC004079 TaxID=3154549 RepID=UPI0033BC18AE